MPHLVRAGFLDEVGSGDGVERVMAQMWRDAGLLEVEFAPPQATRGGKVLHLHRAG